MNADELFDWTGGKLALKQQPKLRNRLEFYDNGPVCKHPVTQYGLVLDVDGSKERYNINFGVLSIEALYDISEGPTCSPDTFRQITALLTRYIEPDLFGKPYVHVASSKNNKLAGTGLHNLGYGKGAYSHEVGAILIINPHGPPTVHLFLDGVEHVLDSGWTAVTSSSHPNKKWQVKF